MFAELQPTSPISRSLRDVDSVAPAEAARIDLALDAVAAAMRGETDLSGYFADLDGLSVRAGPSS